MVQQNSNSNTWLTISYLGTTKRKARSPPAAAYSFYYPTNRFGIQTYTGNQMRPNITPKQFAHLNLVLDEVNHAHLALSKSAVKPISRSCTILATSYSSASIRGSEKNNCSTDTSQNPHTYSHHKSAITSVT